MNKHETEQLIKSVSDFISKQLKGAPKFPVTVKQDEGNLYYVLYGDDMLVGVAGFGSSPDVAYQDFIENWKTAHHKQKTQH